MVRNGIMLKNQTTCHSPALQSAFMGANPLTKIDATSHNGGTINYFQKYRNEVLSRYSMPSYDWGSCHKMTYIPRSDVVSAIGVYNYEKSLAIPINNITTIDPGRIKEVDELYKGVQRHRKQYKDHTRKLHSLDFFRPDEYSYQCAPSLLPSYFFKYPYTYTEYKLPSVLPLTYERRTNTPFIPDLAFPGTYNPGNCIAYKRLINYWKYSRVPDKLTVRTVSVHRHQQCSCVKFISRQRNKLVVGETSPRRNLFTRVFSVNLHEWVNLSGTPLYFDFSAKHCRHCHFQLYDRYRLQFSMELVKLKLQAITKKKQLNEFYLDMTNVRSILHSIE